MQQDWSALPALVPDAKGKYDAFIRDAGKILRYRYEGAKWVRAPAGRLESARDVLYGGSRYGIGTLALRDENNVVFCRMDWGKGIEVQGVSGARGSFFLDTNKTISINEIRASAGFIGVLGRKSFSSEETWKGIYGWRAAYWYWHPDDSAATAVILPDSAYQLVSFAPYRDGLGILQVLRDGFYLLPLSSEGTPQEPLFLAARNFRETAQDTVIKDTSKPGADPEWTDTPPQSFSQVEVDVKGCVHVLDRRLPRNGYRGGKLYYANSCSRLREEELPLPTDGLGVMSAELHDADMHIDSEGKVRVAALQIAYGEHAGFSSTYVPSRLLIAELGEAGWTVEIVATK